jgi:hypothetical protein
MPLVAVLRCVLLACTTPVCGQGAPPPIQDTPRVEATGELEPRGKIVWFRGTFEELLAEATKSKRLVFLDFSSRTNAYSKKLARGTYLDPRVVSELAGLLCYSVDADGKETKPLRKRYQVLSAPALVFLDPDGSLRDQLSGYFPPESFLLELRRIKANTDTFSDLRQRITKNADDLDSRWALACKLRAIGDLAGYEQQISEVRERDREGHSMASKRIRLAALYASAAATLDLEPLYAFVQAEKDPALLFEGWHFLWLLEGQALRSSDDDDARRMHELRYFAAARALWPLVPVDQHGYLGNNIAWSFYENRVRATRSDLEFALSVAESAAAAAAEVPAVVDTLACCLFAVGRKPEALVQVKRCIELDPQNPEWRERQAEFEKTP